jgi:hypothetical protein
MPETLLWIASAISLLYLSFCVIANLHQFFQLQIIRNFAVCLSGKKSGIPTEPRQIIVIDIRSILLCKQIGIDPKSSASGNNDLAVKVFPKPLLEDSPAQVVGLAEHCFPDGVAELTVIDQSLPRCLGKPSCLEDPCRSFGLTGRAISLAPGATAFNIRFFPPNIRRESSLTGIRARRTMDGMATGEKPHGPEVLDRNRLTVSLAGAVLISAAGFSLILVFVSGLPRLFLTANLSLNPMAAALLPMFSTPIVRVFVPMLPMLMVFPVILFAARKRRSAPASRMRKL